MSWRVLHNISSRRHVNAYARIKAAMRLKDAFAAKAKMNMRKSKGRGKKGAAVKKDCAKDSKVNTREELAKIAQVGEKTIQQYQYVETYKNSPLLLKTLNKDNMATLQMKLEVGETTINKVARMFEAILKRASKRHLPKDKGNYVNPKGHENAIRCGNVLKEMAELPSGSVSLIFTSPPYLGVPCNYGGHFDTKMSYSSYLTWLKKVWVEAARVLRKGGRLVINIDSTKTRDDGDSHNYCHFITKDIGKQMDDPQVDLLYMGDIVWDKSELSGSKMACGAVTAVQSSPRIRRQHEYILIFAKETATLVNEQWDQQTEAVDISDKELDELTHSVWKISNGKPKANKHPCVFPDQLAERVIKLCCYPNDLVLDVFNGSGTTTAAAARLGRRWVGIDNNHEYAKKRTEKAAKARKASSKETTTSLSVAEIAAHGPRPILSSSSSGTKIAAEGRDAA
jgi:DNA modification methylase